MKEDVEIKKAVCTFCKGECGVLVHVRDGHLVKTEVDPAWPARYPPTKGCVRLKAAAEWFYHPERVNFPIKRAGERGEGKWQRISWGQALDEIAQRLGETKEKYGAESIAFTEGTSYRHERPLKFRFFNALGSVNAIGSAHICFIPRAAVANTIVGCFPHFSVKPTTKCVVFLGVEPLVSRPHTAAIIQEAVRRGAKTIVIDPRRTRSAARADVWLQLRPGTDAALLLGMIRFMVDEELYDKAFVSKWCHGFDQLRQRIADYPLEKVEAITQVPADRIKEATRVYAANRPGCMIEGMGIEELQSNTEVLHARWILAALAGNIDVEGGEELSGPHPQILTPRELEPRVQTSPAQRSKQMGADRCRLLSITGAEIITESLSKKWAKPPYPTATCAHQSVVYRSVLTGQPYPTRAMVTVASNPMVTPPNTKLVYKALKSLDLYVVYDPWMTPSAELADYVLPSDSWLERPILWDFNGYASSVVAGEASLPTTIPGEYEHLENYQLWRELAIRMGLGQYFPWKNLEGYYDALLKPMGCTHKELVHNTRYLPKPVKFQKYREMGFATPTGKVELYSTIFEKLNYDPLPAYYEPTETQVSNPELAKEYPLTLITGGRILEFYHSEWRHVDSVRRRHPDPIVQIHPDTAKGLGIEDGDWVWIESPRGRVRQKSQLFSDMEPNIVHAEHGWWFPELPGEEPWLHGVWESNINVLTDDDPEICNELTGAYPLRTALCKVYKMKQY